MVNAYAQCVPMTIYLRKWRLGVNILFQIKKDTGVYTLFHMKLFSHYSKVSDNSLTIIHSTLY